MTTTHLTRMMVDSGICDSMSAARRLIKQGAVKVDGEVVGDLIKLTPGDYTIVVGKTKKLVVSRGLPSEVLTTMLAKREKPVQRFWVRWFQDWKKMGSFTLYTPWWISGYEGKEGGREILCAGIKARGVQAVEMILYNCYDKRPNDIEISFITLKDEDWSPFSERFPEGEWMGPLWTMKEYRQGEL